jgi:hypothetical protein
MMFHSDDCPFGCTIHTRRWFPAPWLWHTTINKLPNAKAFSIGGTDFIQVANWVYRSGSSKSAATQIHQLVVDRFYALERSDVRLSEALRVVTEELIIQGFLTPNHRRPQESNTETER